MTVVDRMMIGMAMVGMASAGISQLCELMKLLKEPIVGKGGVGGVHVSPCPPAVEPIVGKRGILDLLENWLALQWILETPQILLLILGKKYHMQ